MSIVKGREKGTKFATGNLEASSPRETGVEQGPNSKYDTMGKLIVYVDSDYGGCKDDKRSKTRVIIKINGAAVIWRKLKHRNCEDHMKRVKIIHIYESETERYILNGKYG